jgi:uncharacterized protein involved in exopolysaccharide biosynthesis
MKWIKSAEYTTTGDEPEISNIQKQLMTSKKLLERFIEKVANDEDFTPAIPEKSKLIEEASYLQKLIDHLEDYK